MTAAVVATAADSPTARTDAVAVAVAAVAVTTTTVTVTAVTTAVAITATAANAVLGGHCQTNLVIWWQKTSRC